MTELLHLNEFFVEGGEPAASHVLLHITEPSRPEEKAKGYFFALAELNGASLKHISKLQNLIDELEHEYFELPDSPDRISLEIAAEKINQESFSLVRPGATLHCLVGALRPPELFFTYTGEPAILLFYKNRTATFETLNLIAATPGTADTPAPDRPQLFSQLVQGKLSPGDYLLVATPHLTNYFTADRLQKIITTRPARQSAEHLERVLKELKGGLSFGGLILEMATPRRPQAPDQSTRRSLRPSSAQSLKALISTEHHTGELLSSALWPRLTRRFSKLFPPPETRPSSSAEQVTAPPPRAAHIEALHLRAHRPAPPRPAPAPVPGAGQSLFFRQTFVPLLTASGRSIWFVFQGLGRLLIGLGRRLAMLFLVITNFQRRRDSILEEWRREWQSWRSQFSSLSLFTKLLIGVGIILAIIGASSVGLFRRAQATKTRLARFEAAAAAIAAERDAAESALLYGDEERAGRELRQALISLAALSCDHKKERARCEEWKNSLAALRLKLRKAQTVSPELLKDFSAQFSAASVGSLARFENKLAVALVGAPQLIWYDLVAREVGLQEFPVAVGEIRALSVPKENDYLAILGAKGVVRLKSPEGAPEYSRLAYPTTTVAIAAAAIYNRRLYTLDTLNHQIYKHDFTASGFERGTPWLREPADLGGAVDLAIDGDVFVLQKDGAILKFLQGKRETWSARPLDPPLQHPALKIWTYADLNYLYLLDPKERRLIILSKDGSLKAQLTAQEWVEPTGMVIDEPNKTAYILDQGKLYKISLPL